MGDSKKAWPVGDIARKAGSGLGGAGRTGLHEGDQQTRQPGLSGVEDQPPGAVRWFSAIQQVAISSIYMIYPLILAREAGLQTGQIINILQLGCVALAIGALLQALPRGRSAAGMLAPSCFTELYLASSLVAVKVGGMPLVWA